jgi:DNA-binding SARP family transcriptional activator
VIDGRAGAPLRFEILGDVRVLRGTEPVDLGPAKQRAVLAVLLLQVGRPVPTHQIVDAVWGDEPPENGANVVQKYVAGLRRVLDPDRAPRTPGELLALTGSGYVLRIGEGTLDADEFQARTARAGAERSVGNLAEAAETLRAALALWRGEALAGFTGPVFEAARARLAESRATAWEKWAEVELARGRNTALVPDLSRLVEEFPLREGLRAQLMIALHQGGRQAEALAVFRDAREYFLDEFGAEPGERMRDAHRKILRGEPFYPQPVDPWADSDPSSGAPFSGSPASYAPAPPGSAAGSPGFAAGSPGFAAGLPGPAAGSSGYAARSPDSAAGSPGSAAGSPGSAAGSPGSAAGSPGSAPEFSGGGPSAAGAGAGSAGDPVVPAQADPLSRQGPQWPGSSPSPAWPGYQQPPAQRSHTVLAVVAAALIPLITFGVGAWIYFVWAAARRRDWRIGLIALGYLAGFVVAMIFMVEIDPTPEDMPNTPATDFGVLLFFLNTLFASVHGAILAARPWNTSKRRDMRAQARAIVESDPAQARQLAIGRPDLPGWFDDGGLLDVNHAPAPVLAAMPGISSALAHRIVMDRQHRGPYAKVDDLVARGVLSRGGIRPLRDRLVAVPPAVDHHPRYAQ